jgi:hypothetical protein
MRGALGSEIAPTPLSLKAVTYSLVLMPHASRILGRGEEVVGGDLHGIDDIRENHLHVSVDAN